MLTDVWEINTNNMLVTTQRLLLQYVTSLRMTVWSV